MLRHVTENRYVKCLGHFFGWNIIPLLGYEKNLLTNRIAGNVMNIKQIKLLKHGNVDRPLRNDIHILNMVSILKAVDVCI